MSTEEIDTGGNAKPEERYEGFIAPDDVGYNQNGGLSEKATITEVLAPGTARDARKVVVDEPVLVFDRDIGKDKRRLALNRTNQRMLKLILGKNPSSWVGKEITLGIGFITAFGERDVPAIRVQLPKGIPPPFGVRKWLGKPKPSGGGK